MKPSRCVLVWCAAASLPLVAQEPIPTPAAEAPSPAAPSRRAPDRAETPPAPTPPAEADQEARRAAADADADADAAVVERVARKVEALLDAGRCLAEATEATGLRRNRVGGAVRSLLASYVRVDDGGWKTVRLPALKAAIRLHEDAAPRLMRTDDADAERFAHAAANALRSNAIEALPADARPALEAWWAARTAAVDAATAELAPLIDRLATRADRVARRAPRAERSPFEGATEDDEARAARDADVAAEAEARRALEEAAASADARRRDAETHLEALRRAAREDPRSARAEDLLRAEREASAARDRARRAAEEIERSRAEREGDPALADPHDKAWRRFEALKVVREDDLRAAVEAMTQARKEAALGAERVARLESLFESLRREGWKPPADDEAARLLQRFAGADRDRPADVLAQELSDQMRLRVQEEAARADAAARTLREALTRERGAVDVDLHEVLERAETERVRARDAAAAESTESAKIFLHRAQVAAEREARRGRDPLGPALAENEAALRALRAEVEALRREIESLRAVRSDSRREVAPPK
ncbi:MAG TPA: hypothetical protein VEI02_12075 [Planctomycetota bacterium]|nr:hypothetical protein [Planctomycetota bacterium]